MSMQDPIADMLVRIANATHRKRETVSMPHNRFKVSILDVMQEQGFISAYEAIVPEDIKKEKPWINVKLRYYDGESVISRLERVSKPSCRVHTGNDDLRPRADRVAIMTTNKGVMTDRQAQKQGLGGEVICYVYT